MKGSPDVDSLPERFSQEGEIGTGFTGVVILAFDEHLKKQVAVKTISKELYERFNLHYPPAEVALVSSLSHEHIVRVLEVIEEPTRIFLVQEYLGGGDLFECMQASDPFPEVVARFLFCDLLAGVSYLHAKGIVHRDIKPENCVLDKNGKLKLIDFGFATAFEPGQLFDDFCASAEYAAPEVLCKVPYQGPPVDVWPLGVLLYEMVLGDLPFHDPQQEGYVLHLDDEAISAELAVLLEQILCENPDERAPLSSIADSPWMVLDAIISDDGGIALEGSFSSVIVSQIKHPALRKRVAVEQMTLEMGGPSTGTGKCSFC